MRCAFTMSRCAFLVSSAEQKGDLFPLLTKIDAIAFPLVDAQLTYAMTYRFHIAKMPELQSLQPAGDFLLRPLVTQTAQP